MLVSSSSSSRRRWPPTRAQQAAAQAALAAHQTQQQQPGGGQQQRGGKGERQPRGGGRNNQRQQGQQRVQQPVAQLPPQGLPAPAQGLPAMPQMPVMPQMAPTMMPGAPPGAGEDWKATLALPPQRCSREDGRCHCYKGQRFRGLLPEARAAHGHFRSRIRKSASHLFRKRAYRLPSPAGTSWPVPRTEQAKLRRL